MFRALLAIAFAICLSTPAKSEFRYSGPESTMLYVESNLLGIFYHEFGHALIDILELPIYGQEEDAADVLSVFLIDQFYNEKAAVRLVYDTALGFLGEIEQSERAGYEPAYWDVHGPDLQRYYNLVCIFYGANPREREALAVDLELPEARAEYCDYEYDQAAHSWGGVMERIYSEGGGNSILMGRVVVESDGGDLTAALMAKEVEALNQEFRLPKTLRVTVEPCGVVNAFYDPSSREIIMCTEFADDLVEWAPEF